MCVFVWFFVDIFVNKNDNYSMPRTKEQNLKLLEERKNEIIKAAIKLFAVKNYRTATVDDITTTLNISHGLFYHYFKNKKDLLQTIVKYAENTVMSKIYDIANTYTGELFFLHFYNYFLKLLESKEKILLLIFLNSFAAGEKLSRYHTDTSLEKFYNSVFLKNVQYLFNKKALIQDIESTFKLLYIVSNGLCILAYENKLGRIGINSAQILRSFIKH